MLTLIGSLINGTDEVLWGMRKIHKRRMKGDDPEIDTAQTQKLFGGRLGLLEKNRKTFIDSIPNKRQ